MENPKGICFVKKPILKFGDYLCFGVAAPFLGAARYVALLVCYVAFVIRFSQHSRNITHIVARAYFFRIFKAYSVGAYKRNKRKQYCAAAPNSAMLPRSCSVNEIIINTSNTGKIIIRFKLCLLFALTFSIAAWLGSGVFTVSELNAIISPHKHSATPSHPKI